MFSLCAVCNSLIWWPRVERASSPFVRTCCVVRPDRVVGLLRWDDHSTPEPPHTQPWSICSTHVQVNTWSTYQLCIQYKIQDKWTHDPLINCAYSTKSKTSEHMIHLSTVHTVQNPRHTCGAMSTSEHQGALYLPISFLESLHVVFW